MISSEHPAAYFYALGVSATTSMPIPDFSRCFVRKNESISTMLGIVLELLVYISEKLSDFLDSVQNIRNSPGDFNK